jgi:uncharacterized protein YpuA (DUF1002 family)
MNSLDELIRAFSLIEEIVEEPIEYRIHYDTAGNITMCTMQDHPDDTQYIVVSKDEYDSYFRYYVVDSKLKKIDIPSSNSIQLTKSDSGYQVVKNHAGLIVEAGETYEDIEYYDTTN